MKILHIDKNHPLMLAQLAAQGFENHEDYTSTKAEIEAKIADYDGIIIRSRFPIDKPFLDKATHLNKFKKANNEIKNGKWLREENRGWELDGKTIGIIGYGNMGKSFAKKLRGFDCQVICYDILPNKGDENARQVTLVDFFRQADVVSLHTPQTPQTTGMINEAFINSFAKSFWFLNTARGKSVVTDDLVRALQSGKVLGAGLDVLEYEKASFEDFFSDKQMPESFKYLLEADNVILTPHIAGWTLESKEKLAQTIVDKIISKFGN